MHVLLYFQPAAKDAPPDPILNRCTSILTPLTNTVPGMLEALYLKAQVSYLAGEVDDAQNTLQHCLDQDSSFSDAHILMAQVLE